MVKCSSYRYICTMMDAMFNLCRTSVTSHMCSCHRLSLNRSGGRCLDEEGTKVRQWSWNSQNLTSSPLQPVFLSLNKSVGVRVLGKEQVFVSFLARGQQAKFSVGSCCAQVKSIFLLCFKISTSAVHAESLFVQIFCSLKA